MSKAQTKAAKPLLRIDRQARKLFNPYRNVAAIKAVAWFGQAGDQLQLRMLCGGVLVAGVARRDGRMIAAAGRMLLAHELATLAKKAIKNRVDRWRPRNAGGGKPATPRKGRSRAKALNSFPSGHSAGAMAVACAVATAYPEHRGAALAAGSAVSLVQVPTGAHYPTDVAAGMVIGAATERVIRLFGMLWQW